MIYSETYCHPIKSTAGASLENSHPESSPQSIVTITFFATDEPIKILRVTDYTATSDVPIGKGYYAVSKIIYKNKSASKILGRKINQLLSPLTSQNFRTKCPKQPLT